MACVVPKGIVEQLDIESGDYLDWNVQSENGDKFVIVRKVSETKNV
jgi:hypothetical protein